MRMRPHGGVERTTHSQVYISPHPHVAHLLQTPPPFSKDNSAANSSRTAVKCEIQPISDLINAFIHRKHACGRNRRGKRGHSAPTRCMRLRHTFDYLTPPIDRPTVENHCAYVSIEIVTCIRKPI